ncbi:Zn-ribbon-containing, possibly RNA-binding protein and truncated derivatives [Roseibium album]|nr:Zn-ribbon-containing, possibly RNA-binding protein and truncated derivatives [Roseibium album]
MAKANPVRKPKEAKRLADLVSKAMTPACKKRGFASVDIVASWADIVGDRYGTRVQPDRLIWPRQTELGDPDAPRQPATLVVHTDGATALMLSHESGQVIERINTFYGWAAIGRIKILQKPVSQKKTKSPKPLRSLTQSEEKRLDESVEGVENDRLRQALKKLGAQVIAKTGTL